MQASRDSTDTMSAHHWQFQETEEKLILLINYFPFGISFRRKIISETFRYVQMGYQFSRQKFFVSVLRNIVGGTIYFAPPQGNLSLLSKAFYEASESTTKRRVDGFEVRKTFDEKKSLY